MKPTIATLGEFGLIEHIKTQFPTPEGVEGIGDDCAILPQTTGLDTLFSTDLLVEGIHFLRQEIPPHLLGWKSAAVNISDIAAMGGKPTGTFLSIAFPKDLEMDWVEGFISGYREISNRYDIPLLGGDTTGSQGPICINVGIMGQIPHGNSKLRAHAQAGDLICVTGNLGDSGIGLKIILDKLNHTDLYGQDADAQALIHRHYHPVPQVEAGLILSHCPGVHAMMDLSDGIGSDLRHILKASHVGAHLDASLLPLSAEAKRFCQRIGWEPRAFALNGGEDYQLLFTMDEDCRPETPYTVVGRITESLDLDIEHAPQEARGFHHF